MLFILKKLPFFQLNSSLVIIDPGLVIMDTGMVIMGRGGEHLFPFLLYCTAPCSSMMHQYKSFGPVLIKLLLVVVLDDPLITHVAPLYLASLIVLGSVQFNG